MTIDYSSVRLLVPGIGADESVDVIDYGPKSLGLNALNGAKIDTAQSKYYGSALFFDGANDALVVPDAGKTFDLAALDFLIECWIYRSGGSGERTIISKWGPSGPFLSWLCSINSSGEATFYYTTDGSTGVFSEYTSGYAVANTTWTHIRICRVGTTLKIFLDGVSRRTNASFSSTIFNERQVNVAVGASNAGAGGFFPGWINDLHVSIGGAYSLSDFTPPARLCDTLSGTVLDDTGSPASGRAVVAVPRSYPVRGFHGVTDGSGDYSLWVPSTECSRLVFDDDGGTLYNDIVDRVIPG